MVIKMTIEQILKSMEDKGLYKEMSFSIDYLDEYSNECIIDIEIEFDEDASVNEFNSPTWVITSSDSDCEHYCSITDEYEEGIFIGSQEVRYLLKLEEYGVDDRWNK